MLPLADAAQSDNRVAAGRDARSVQGCHPQDQGRVCGLHGGIVVAGGGERGFVGLTRFAGTSAGRVDLSSGAGRAVRV